MMEPGPGESTGTDAEPVIPSGTDAEEVSGETVRKDTPAEPEDPVRRRTSGRQRRASLEEYRETYLTVPKIRNRKTVFVRYAHVATMQEIEENGFNLNIPRYVDTFEPEEEIDLNAVAAEIRNIQAEIKGIDAQLKPFFDELGLDFPFDVEGK